MTCAPLIRYTEPKRTFSLAKLRSSAIRATPRASFSPRHTAPVHHVEPSGGRAWPMAARTRPSDTVTRPPSRIPPSSPLDPLALPCVGSSPSFLEGHAGGKVTCTTMATVVRDASEPTGCPCTRVGGWKTVVAQLARFAAVESQLRQRLSERVRRVMLSGASLASAPANCAWPIAVAASVLLLGDPARAHAVAAGDPQATSPGTMECGCPPQYDARTPVGVAWQSAGPGPNLPDVARILAPVLWFSADEPLLVFRNGRPIPHAHPADEPAAGAVVYYQATDIVLRAEERVDHLADSDPRFFEKVDHFLLKYYFYYDEDFGLGPHPHDLEVLTLLVYLERTAEGCVRLRVPRIEGLAHGLDWYSNIHRTQRDTVFPITVLVEEGKHASVPDRNADGVYTPGYDVNVRVNDAWGLRDILGSAVLLGARYTASMSKPRIPRFRMLPPEDVAACGQRRGRQSADTEALGRYELRSASRVGADLPPGVPEPQRLLRMMAHHRFGAGWPAEQHDSDLARALSDPENLFKWVSAINARIDSRLVGAAIQGPGLDLRELWVVPRILINRGWAVEAMVTPSASRWADWYAAAGYERGLTPPRDLPGDTRGRNGFASEVGLKLRVTASGRARWALLGYRFAGVRLGVRATGFTRLQQPRLIAEIGAGAF